MNRPGTFAPRERVAATTVPAQAGSIADRQSSASSSMVMPRPGFVGEVDEAVFDGVVEVDAVFTSSGVYDFHDHVVGEGGGEVRGVVGLAVHHGHG